MMWPLVLVVPVMLALLSYALWQAGSDEPGSRRRSLLFAAVATAAWTVIGTESLSFFGALRFGPVLAWWILGLLVALTLALYYRGLRIPSSRREAMRRDRTVVALFSFTSAILLITGIIAATTPTNTWDCLQYHLPRQFYWHQQHSVAHFPALDLRQVEMPPFAEYASLHMWILTGMDHWGNMVQWLAFALAAVAASMVALEAGVARRGQAMAALFVVANPAAATQATNGKNDVVVALWLLILFWIAVQTWCTRRFSLTAALVAGAALGLAVLTKGTAYIFGLPICLMLGVGMLRARGLPRAIPPGLVMVAAFAALNAAHWSRNYAEFGSPLSLSPAKGGIKFYNTEFSLGAVASNLVRNAAIHTSLPEQVPLGRGNVINLPAFAAGNQAQTRAIQRFHDWLGQDMNTRDTTFGVQTFAVRDTWYHDGNNPAPMLLLLAMVVLAAALIRPRLALRSPAAPALLVPFAGMLLFAILLRWQPWHARLHIPALALLAPVAAAVVVRLPIAPLRASLVLLTMLLAWPAIIMNHAKPLLGQNSIFSATGEQIRWQYRAAHMGPINEAAAAVRDLGPRIVAVDVGELPGEYPALWTLRQLVGPHVEIREYRRNLGPPISEETIPDVVLSWPRQGAPARVRDQRGRVYSAIQQFGPVMLFQPGEVANQELRFLGWTTEEGLFRPQGRITAEMLRWGHGPRTKLQFLSTGEQTKLVVEAKPAVPGQIMTIWLNGEQIHQLEFSAPGPFLRTERQFSPRRGSNELVFEYALQDSAGQPPARSVLFQRLQILPLGSSAPRPPG